MHRIAAVGDKDSVYGFASLGLDIFPVEEEVQAVQTVRKLANDGYGVIYITEYLASLIPEEIERYREMPLPAIILIPGVKANTGMGMKGVSKSVEQAVGSDIISED